MKAEFVRAILIGSVIPSLPAHTLAPPISAAPRTRSSGARRFAPARRTDGCRLPLPHTASRHRRPPMSWSRGGCQNGDGLLAALDLLAAARFQPALLVLFHHLENLARALGVGAFRAVRMG